MAELTEHDGVGFAHYTIGHSMCSAHPAVAMFQGLDELQEEVARSGLFWVVLSAVVREVAAAKVPGGKQHGLIVLSCC